jgi:hypothetical protein
MKQNWQQSVQYIEYLRTFSSPKDRYEDRHYERYLAEQLKSKPQDVVQMFLDEGMLIVPELHEILDRLHRKTPIEDKLKELGLNSRGTKSQIIQRLIDSNLLIAKEMTQGREMFICSPLALTVISEFDKRKNEAEKNAKHESFTALVKGDDRKAHDIAIKYQREFYKSNENLYFDGDKMEIILSANPALINHLDNESKSLLRAVCCMPLIWYDEKPVEWLPETFKSKIPDTLINLFIQHSEILDNINRYDDEDKIEIIFDRYDIDSCNLCRGLDGKTLLKKEIPELPYLNCTSQKGCQCDFDYNLELDDEEDVEGIFSDITFDIENIETLIVEKVNQLIQEHIEIRLDPISKLRTLKQMVEENLITQNDYEEMKKQILSQM